LHELMLDAPVAEELVTAVRVRMSDRTFLVSFQRCECRHNMQLGPLCLYIQASMWYLGKNPTVLALCSNIAVAAKPVRSMDGVGCSMVVRCCSCGESSRSVGCSRGIEALPAGILAGASLSITASFCSDAVQCNIISGLLLPNTAGWSGCAVGMSALPT